MAKFQHFGKYLKSLAIFEVYLVLGNDFGLLWHNLNALGQFFIAVNGQMLRVQSGHMVTLLNLQIATT